VPSTSDRLDPSASSKALLVFCEGAHWALFEPLLQRGLLPTIQRLRETGSYGSVHSQAPFLPHSLFASACTGRRVSEHGVIHNELSGLRKPQPNPAFGLPAIWEAAQAHGIASLRVNTPDNVGAGLAVHDDFFSQPNPSPNSISKPEYFDELLELRVKPAELDPRVVALLCPTLTPEVAKEDPLVQCLAGCLTKLYSVHNVAISLVETEAWDLAVVRFSFLENVLRHFGHFTPGNPSAPHAYRERYGAVLEGACRIQDLLLGELLSAAGEQVQLYFLSTCGQRPIQGPQPLPYPLVRPAMGLFLSSSPSLSQNRNLGTINLLDLAPTVASQLGFSFSIGHGGRVLNEHSLTESRLPPSNCLPPTPPPRHEDYTAFGCFALGLDLYESGQPPLALPFFEQAAWNAPESLQHCFWLACVQAKLGMQEDLEQTLGILQKQGDSNHPLLHYLRALIASQSGQLHEVTSLLSELAKATPLPPAIATCYVQALIDTEQWAEAMEFLNTEVERRPAHDVWMKIARCGLELKRYEDAARAARHVLEDNPGLAQAHLLLARALKGQSRDKEAEVSVFAAQRLAPDWPEVHQAIKDLTPDSIPMNREIKRTNHPSPAILSKASNERLTLWRRTHHTPDSGLIAWIPLVASMTYRKPTALQHQRATLFLNSQLELNDPWNPRVWVAEQPYPHIVGAGSWRLSENNKNAEVLFRLLPSYTDSLVGGKMLQALLNEVQAQEPSRIIFTTPQKVSWNTLLPKAFSTASTWTDEDWQGDPYRMRNRLITYRPLLKQALQSRWHLRPIKNTDWIYVQEWGLKKDHFDQRFYNRIQTNARPDLSSIVECEGRIAGLLVASQRQRSTRLEFIAGNPVASAQWPIATLLMLSHLLSLDRPSVNFDQLTLTTNLHNGKAMHRLAHRLGMTRTREHFHASITLNTN